MKVLVRAMSVALGVCALASTAHAGNLEAAGGRYVVVFKTGTLPADADARIAANGGQVTRSFDQLGVAIAQGNANFIERMKRDRTVLAVGAEGVFARPDVAVEMLPSGVGAEAAPTANDWAYFSYQWDMRRIGAPAVWARLPLSANTPRVAVLDTGVMHTHPDLAGQVDASVATTYCNTAGPGGAAGYPVYSTLIDLDAHPDWTPADGCTPVTSTYESHGTHVAGTIAAKIGGGAVVGVAPDARVGAYKVFDRYRYTRADGRRVDDVGAFDGPLFSAIIAATEAGYPVISMSLGGHVMRSDSDDNASWLAWDRVAKWANRNGALIVGSAGNSAYNLNGALAHFPSDLSTVLSTSATGSSGLVMSNGMVVSTGDVLAEYSNYGSSVDIAAPGGDCGPNPATCIGQYLIANTGISATGLPTYLLMAGTSMATPHVSAVAAQVRSQHPDWTPGEVRSWLKETAQNIGSRQAFGAGMLDADAATR